MLSVYLRLVIAITILVCGQYLPAQTDHSSGLSELWEGKGAIILDDDLEVNVFGREHNPQSFEFTRKVKFKIINAEGVEDLSKWSFPEIFDPTYQAHAPAFKKVGMYYSGYKIRELSFKITRKGKGTFTASTKKKVKNIRSVSVDYFYNFSQDMVTVSDLQIGDELTVEYQISVPNEENYSRYASYRIFFNDRYPKLRYRLTISCHKTLDMDLYQFFISAAPREYERDNVRYFEWKQENLPGCIEETGSRPHRELPHVTWVVNKFRYFQRYAQLPDNVPHYAIIAGLRAPRLLNMIASIQVGSKSKQFAPFTRAYAEITGGYTDGYEKMAHIHKIIVNDFTYKKDIEYYDRSDLRSERIGEFFENKVIRDRSRYNIYFASMHQSGQDFYSTFVIDKRTGRISDQFFQPTFNDDFLLAVYMGRDQFSYFLPKSNNFGWYENEIPFYWEGATARLVHVSDYSNQFRTIKDKFRSSELPIQDPSTNSRVSKATVTIENDKQMKLKYQLQLSGQFSTMTRGLYMNNFRDHTVDKDYHRKIWDVNSEVEVLSKEMKMVNEQSPFSFALEAEVQNKNGVNSEGGVQVIDLAGWFPHIIPDNLKQSHRFTDFYPDFLGEDLIQYQIRFDRPVEFIDLPSKLSISNGYGKYDLTIWQPVPGTLQITSILTVHGAQIAPYDYDWVTSLYRGVKETAQLKIRYR